MSNRVVLVVSLLATLVGCTLPPNLSGLTTTPGLNTYTGAFASFPRQAAPSSVSGSNVVVENKSWVGFRTRTCLTVHDAHNVYIHDVDFAGCGGGIFLVNVTG